MGIKKQNIKKNDQIWGVYEYVPVIVGDWSRLNVIGKLAGNEFLSTGLRRASISVNDKLLVIGH